MVILLYKAIRFFCLKLSILATTEQIEFSVLGKVNISTVILLDYFVFRFKSLSGFKLFFLPLSTPLNIDTLDARDIAAS